MKSKRKLDVRYTDENGSEHVFVLTDADADGKPEVFFQHPDIFGEKRSIGPIESPVALPDFMAILSPVLGRLLPAGIASFFGVK